eukprot:scaffold15721_cov112-Isochrysis_galbana.AAC.8
MSRANRWASVTAATFSSGPRSRVSIVGNRRRGTPPNTPSAPWKRPSRRRAALRASAARAVPPPADPRTQPPASSRCISSSSSAFAGRLHSSAPIAQRTAQVEDSHAVASAHGVHPVQQARHHPGRGLRPGVIRIGARRGTVAAGPPSLDYHGLQGRDGRHRHALDQVPHELKRRLAVAIYEQLGSLVRLGAARTERHASRRNRAQRNLRVAQLGRAADCREAEARRQPHLGRSGGGGGQLNQPAEARPVPQICGERLHREVELVQCCLGVGHRRAKRAEVAGDVADATRQKGAGELGQHLPCRLDSRVGAEEAGVGCEQPALLGSVQQQHGAQHAPHDASVGVGDRGCLRLIPSLVGVAAGRRRQRRWPRGRIKPHMRQHAPIEPPAQRVRVIGRRADWCDGTGDGLEAEPKPERVVAAEPTSAARFSGGRTHSSPDSTSASRRVSTGRSAGLRRSPVARRLLTASCLRSSNSRRERLCRSPAPPPADGAPSILPALRKKLIQPAKPASRRSRQFGSWKKPSASSPVVHGPSEGRTAGFGSGLLSRSRLGSAEDLRLSGREARAGWPGGAAEAVVMPQWAAARGWEAEAESPATLGCTAGVGGSIPRTCSSADRASTASRKRGSVAVVAAGVGCDGRTSSARDVERGGKGSGNTDFGMLAHNEGMSNDSRSSGSESSPVATGDGRVCSIGDVECRLIGELAGAQRNAKLKLSLCRHSCERKNLTCDRVCPVSEGGSGTLRLLCHWCLPVDGVLDASSRLRDALALKFYAQSCRLVPAQFDLLCHVAECHRHPCDGELCLAVGWDLEPRRVDTKGVARCDVAHFQQLKTRRLIYYT